MASVAVIHATRRLLSATALKVYALVASVYALGILVWVARVGENFSAALQGGAGKLVSYLAAAVFNTELAVQVVLLVALFALVSLVVDLARSSTPQKRLAF